MIVTCLYVYVKIKNINEFIEASTEIHNRSIQEAGNLRYDILQCIGEPTRFLFYEAYESEEAAAEHKKTEHYLKWREAVAKWMENPREGVKYDIIFPKEKNIP